MRLANVTMLALIIAFGGSGCITTTSGGMPEPASEESRVNARLDLARGYINADLWSEAKRTLMQVLKINPRSVEAHTLLALVYEADGEAEVAEKYYTRALKIDRNDAQTLNNYGTFLYRKGRPEEAAKKLRLVVQNTDYRARSQAYENLGLAELALANRDAARTAFTRALSLNPMQATSMLELSSLAFEESHLRDAMKYYDDYRSVAKQTPRSLCLGMKIGSAVGNTDQVASYRLALKNLYSDSSEARECQANSR